MWNMAEANKAGGRAAVSRMQVAGRRREIEKERLFAERGWRPLHEWDLEELSRFQPRQADGTWPSGPRPQWTEPFVREEVRRRFKEEGERQVWMLVPAAMRVLGDIIVDKDADQQLRVKAAIYVMDRAFGKPTQQIEAEIQTKATDFLAERVVLDDGADAHPVVNGHLVDDPDDEPKGE